MHERILIPTDGSTGMAHVALQAIDLAEKYDATLHVVNVVDTDLISALSDINATRAELKRQGKDAVKRIEEMAHVHGLTAETEIRDGDPADEILAYADEIDADVIVTGTHGRSGVKRRLIGSVAERLVRHASSPVMTVRLPETDETVEDEARARKLAEQALQHKQYEASITSVEQDETVWVVDASADGESLVVYIDPVTQLTSVTKRD